MPVNKTGLVTRLEGPALQALNNKVVTLEQEVINLRVMVEDQLEEIAALKEVAIRANTAQDYSPIGTPAIQMPAPNYVTLNDLDAEIAAPEEE